MVPFQGEILIVVGVLAIIEAILAATWKKNDLSLKAQVARMSRVVGGVVVVVIGIMNVIG